MRFERYTPGSDEYRQAERKLKAPTRFDYDALAEHYNSAMTINDITVFAYSPRSISNLKVMLKARGLEFGQDYRCRGHTERGKGFVMFLKRLSDKPMLYSADVEKSEPGAKSAPRAPRRRTQGKASASGPVGGAGAYSGTVDG